MSIAPKNEDKYVHGMGWQRKGITLSDLSNYRKYQHALISRFIGKNILEVGSGDRGFTKQMVISSHKIERIVSIEPSQTLFAEHKNKYDFPKKIFFDCIDLFDVSIHKYGLFDTIILVHVLEHIEKDMEALNKAHELLEPHGHVLIEVPALQFLFSVHDKILGHYRRYDKHSLRSIIDPGKYIIKDIWYQDIFGVAGSFFFFTIRKIELESDRGIELVKKQGKLYDRYLIPLQGFVEKFVRVPFGLSLTAVLQKRSLKP